MGFSVSAFCEGFKRRKAFFGVEMLGGKVGALSAWAVSEVLGLQAPPPSLLGVAAGIVKSNTAAPVVRCC